MFFQARQERSDNRFEFLERYGSCRVVRSQEVPGTAEGAPSGGLQGPLAAIVGALLDLDGAAFGMSTCGVTAHALRGG